MRKKKKTEPIAAVRVDGGKRTDLKRLRERQQAYRAKLADQTAKPIEDDRVAQVWSRQAAQAAAADRTAKSAKVVGRLITADGGKEGARLSIVKVRISGERNERQVIRSRPGTFEWRYGRNRQDALFHAGSHFARLWERAGIAIASSADFLRGTSSGYATGISDSRVIAVKQVSEAVREIGRLPSERLIDYCVLGETTSSIARKHDQVDRDMAAVLHQDLRACALHFRYL